MIVRYNRLLNQFEDNAKRTALPRAWALKHCEAIVDGDTGEDITFRFANKLEDGPDQPLYGTKKRACRRCGALSTNYFYCGERCLGEVMEYEASTGISKKGKNR